MAPTKNTFLCSELEQRIHELPNGKRRKGQAIDLKDCELMELVQYACSLKGSPNSAQSIIQCEPVVKLFRK